MALTCPTAVCDYATNNATKHAAHVHHSTIAVGGPWACQSYICGMVFCTNEATEEHMQTCADFAEWNSTRKNGTVMNKTQTRTALLRAKEILAGTLGTGGPWNARTKGGNRANNKTTATIKSTRKSIRTATTANRSTSTPATPRRTRATKRKASEIEESGSEDNTGTDDKGEIDKDFATPADVATAPRGERLPARKAGKIRYAGVQKQKFQPQSNPDLFASRRPAVERRLFTSSGATTEEQDSVGDQDGVNEQDTSAAEPMPKTLSPPAQSGLRRSTRNSAAAITIGTSSTQDDQDGMSAGTQSMHEEDKVDSAVQNVSGGSPIRQDRRPAGKGFGQEKRDRMNWERIVRSKGFVPRKQGKKGKKGKSKRK